jgi:hypothetical protein
LFSKDTTIVISSIPVHFRVKASGKRLNDEIVQTVNGTYTAKKFTYTSGLYAVVIGETPLVVAPDTTWLATGTWMVKRVSPSVTIDLSLFGLGVMFYPGKMYEPVIPVGIKNISGNVPDKFVLEQNYPNPFNPTTNIKYQITKSNFVTLKILDALGRDVATIVNEKQNAGIYEATFDGSGLTSGVYFYKLTAGDFVETRKMVLVK